MQASSSRARLFSLVLSCSFVRACSFFVQYSSRLPERYGSVSNDTRYACAGNATCDATLYDHVEVIAEYLYQFGTLLLCSHYNAPVTAMLNSLPPFALINCSANRASAPRPSSAG